MLHRYLVLSPGLLGASDHSLLVAAAVCGHITQLQ